MDVIVDRCAGLDVHKKTVMATVRIPDGSGGRGQTTREFGTFTNRLVELRDWLVESGATQVAMEATGVYWKPVWHVLEDAGFELLLVNPGALPEPAGPQDRCEGLRVTGPAARVRAVVRVVHTAAEIAKLWDLTRYRTKIIGERVRETQQIQKLLEDAGIKLDSVATDVFGCRAGGCSKRSSPVSAIPKCWPTWP